MATLTVKVDVDLKITREEAGILADGLEMYMAYYVTERTQEELLRMQQMKNVLDGLCAAGSQEEGRNE